MAVYWAWNEKRINPEFITTTDTLYVVKSNTLNLREAPNTKSKIVGQVKLKRHFKRASFRPMAKIDIQRV
jgi:hypothetical protein